MIGLAAGVLASPSSVGAALGRARPVWGAAACLVLAAAGRGDDWPEFRGPTGQGVVKEGRLPTEWGPAKNVAWKQAIPGLGWSSPILCRGRVYLTTAVPAGGGDQSLQALCLDAATGKIVWTREVFRQDGARSPRIHAKNSHASPTPVTDGQRLYVHFGHQGTACLDLAGTVVWRNTDFKYRPVHGNGGSPILFKDLLIFSADGADKQLVIALRKDNGKAQRQTDRKTDYYKKFSFSTPLLIELAGQPQVVSPGSGVICSYDPATGKEIWRVRTDGYSVVPRPVYGHGLVYVCTGFERPVLLAIRPSGRGDVTETHIAWQTSRGVPHNPSPLLAGDELYFVSDGGVASCLDAKTGKRHWQQRVGGSHSASPLVAGSKLYFQDEEGTGVVVQAGRTFELLARNALEERTLASYAAADGALFIRTEKHLYKIQAR
jgi:outer membrane protein assembly factor BamB